MEEPEIDRWYHFAATLTAEPDGRAGLHIFVDGKMKKATVGLATESPCASPYKRLVLCGAFANHLSFAGEIDDLHISKAIRHQGDHAPAPPQPDGETLVYLDFETDPIVDRSTNAATITTQGNPQRTRVPR